MKVIWNDTLIAESDSTLLIEGNHYFPPDSVNYDYLITSDSTSDCPWKGKAHYYSVMIGKKTNLDAAWYYPEPLNAAKEIKGYLAFWRGIEIVE